MRHQVTVTETIVRFYEVEASSPADAVALARAVVADPEYVLPGGVGNTETRRTVSPGWAIQPVA